MRDTSFTRRYRLLLIAAHVVVMAVFIGIMHFSILFQAILLAACALVFAWILTPREHDEPPCGEEVGGEGIARHTQAWHQAD